MFVCIWSELNIKPQIKNWATGESDEKHNIKEFLLYRACSETNLYETTFEVNHFKIRLLMFTHISTTNVNGKLGEIIHLSLAWNQLNHSRQRLILKENIWTLFSFQLWSGYSFIYNPSSLATNISCQLLLLDFLVTISISVWWMIWYWGREEALTSQFIYTQCGKFVERRIWHSCVFQP